MKFLLGTQSPEVFTGIIILNITTVTAQTSISIKQHITYSLVKSITDPWFLGRLHYCLTFHRLCLFRNSATPRMCPSKIGNTMRDKPSSCFKNDHCCRHRNSVVSVVCYPVLHVCFYIRSFCYKCTKRCLFFSNYCTSSPYLLHLCTIFLV